MCQHRLRTYLRRLLPPLLRRNHNLRPLAAGRRRDLDYDTKTWASPMETRAYGS